MKRVAALAACAALAAAACLLGPARGESHSESGPDAGRPRTGHDENTGVRSTDGSSPAPGTGQDTPAASPDGSGPAPSRGLSRARSRVSLALSSPAKKDLAQQIVASAENGTLDWRSAYGYVEDIGDGQGYTAGLIGFCTGTHDLLALVEKYTAAHPHNALARYLPALRRVDGTDSHAGLDPGFPAAWRAEARVPAFRAAQDAERDRVYFDPAVRRAEGDGLGALGQFAYYDALVYHGPGTGSTSFDGIRATARARARTPADGGDENTYLAAFLDARRAAMRAMHPGVDTSRVDTAQRRFLTEGNLTLRTPLEWRVYGETYRVR